MGSWTTEDNEYLSYLLDDVTGTEEIVKMRQDYCKINDCVRYIKSNSRVYYTGSKAEGLDLPGSDHDYMVDINDIYNIEVSESARDFVQSMHRNKFLIATDNVPPAFAMLKCVTLQNQYLLNSTVNMDGNAYLSSQLFLQLSPLLTSKIETRRIQGPSIESWDVYAKTSMPGIDKVPSIHCKSWPTSAAEWKDRPRYYGWPCKDDKEYIEAFGCHLVPIGHPRSANKSLEWRFSFSIAERTLVWSFNHTQLQCYALMKLILKEFVKRKCDKEHKGVLCSYFIKTLLFWQFETTDQLFWEMKNLSGCIMFLLDELYICIQTGVLRHYFVPRFNLLETKLTPNAQSELLYLFCKLRESGIQIIGRCISLSGMFSNFVETRDKRHCVERKTEIHKRRRLDNDEIAMNFASTKMYDIIDILNNPLFYECSVAALVRLYICEYFSSPLSVFFIRRLCLLTTITKLYYSINQCNKYVHGYITSLRKNIYGIDIASSKLWLSTFLLQRGDYCRSLKTVNDTISYKVCF